MIFKPVESFPTPSHRSVEHEKSCSEDETSTVEPYLYEPESLPMLVRVVMMMVTMKAG